MSKEIGKYGGKVLRKFEGGGKHWIPGAMLSAEDVELWPHANKQSLHNLGIVDWFDAPDAEEEEVRGKAKKVVEKSSKDKPKASEVVREKKTNPAALKKSRRTN